MLKITRQIPVKPEQQEFCQYMNYKLIKVKNDYLIYEIPANHICRFNLNYDKWKAGTFNKETFLRYVEEK